jgi:hypothetical protein
MGQCGQVKLPAFLKERKSELSLSHSGTTQIQEEEAVQNCEVQQVKI